MILVFRSLHHKHILTLFHRVIGKNVGKNVNRGLLTISKNNTLDDSTLELSGIFKKLSNRGSPFIMDPFVTAKLSSRMF